MPTNPKLKLLQTSKLLLICVLSGHCWAGVTEFISSNSKGTLGDIRHNDSPDISADGRYVVFSFEESKSDEDGATHANWGIYVYDRIVKDTTLVSVKSDGTQIYGHSNIEPGISADGRFVTFTSSAPLSNLDTNLSSDVYVHDRLTHKTELVSVNSSGLPGNSDSSSSNLSSDGRFVVFESEASNLVNADTNGYPDIFVHDRLTHLTTRVSIATDGTQAISGEHGFLMGRKPAISADGRFVAFSSLATNLIQDDTNGFRDIFVHDRQTKQTTRASIHSNGSQAQSSSDFPDISANGRFVVFQSDAPNIISGGSAELGIYLHDRLTKQTVLANESGTNAAGTQPSISADGRYVAYMSYIPDFTIPNFIGSWNVIVHDRIFKSDKIASIDNHGGQGNQGDILGWYWNYYPKINATGRFVTFATLVSLVDEDLLSDQDPLSGQDGLFIDIYLRDIALNTARQGDLQVELIQQPTTLTPGEEGNYVYKITNHGPDTIHGVKALHLISNADTVEFSTGQGRCYRYATISLCNLLRLDSGDSLTLSIKAKATRSPINAQLSVTSNGHADPQPANNFVNVETSVAQ